MNLLKRIFNVGRAEVNSAVKKVEDPVKLLDLEITDLKVFQKNATEEYKQAFINLGAMKNEYNLKLEEIDGLTQKAKDILDMSKGDNPRISEEEAKERALKALTRKNKIVSDVEKLKPQIDSDETKIKLLLKRLEDTSDKLEQKQDDLKTLKLRQSMNKASKNLNDILSKTTPNISGDDISQQADEKISDETARLEAEEQAIVSLGDVSIEVKQNQIDKKAKEELEALLGN